MRDVLKIGLDGLVEALRGAGETTRLRILALLRDGDLTVKDLTQILNQSQPRVSRHLKLLVEADLIERFPEGSWVYYRLSSSQAGRLTQTVLDTLDTHDTAMQRDRERLAEVKARHAEEAARFFAKAAAEWDAIRSHHVAEEAVEAALLELLGDTPFNTLLDVGTGTGRMLQLFADHYTQGVGIDASLEMLGVARVNLSETGLTKAQVRFGDIFALPVTPNSFDVAIVHQVLHFLDDPARALKEIAKTLRPGGRLLIVDFAPHQLESLRETQAHRRLGFSEEQITQWVEDIGLDMRGATHLTPQRTLQGGHGEALTVSLFLAQDPRILLAGDAERNLANAPSQEIV